MNNSSWFPVRNFTKSTVNRDWMFGATKFSNCKDALDPSHKIKKYETVFWNRSMKNACISLESYKKAKKNPELLEKLRMFELPSDIDI